MCSSCHPVERPGQSGYTHVVVVVVEFNSSVIINLPFSTAALLVVNIKILTGVWDILDMMPAGYYRDFGDHMDGLVQERGNSIANALELHPSCTNPSILLKSLKLVDRVSTEKNDSIKSHNLMRMSLLSIIHGLAGLFLGSFDKHGLIATRIWISSVDSRFAPGQ